MRAQGLPVEEQLKIVITQKCRGDGYDDEQQDHGDDNRDADRYAVGSIKLDAVGCGGLR